MYFRTLLLPNIRCHLWLFAWEYFKSSFSAHNIPLTCSESRALIHMFSRQYTKYWRIKVFWDISGRKKFHETPRCFPHLIQIVGEPMIALHFANHVGEAMRDRYTGREIDAKALGAIWSCPKECDKRSLAGQNARLPIAVIAGSRKRSPIGGIQFMVAMHLELQAPQSTWLSGQKSVKDLPTLVVRIFALSTAIEISKMVLHWKLRKRET